MNLGKAQQPQHLGPQDGGEIFILLTEFTQFLYKSAAKTLRYGLDLNSCGLVLDSWLQITLNVRAPKELDFVLTK